MCIQWNRRAVLAGCGALLAAVGMLVSMAPATSLAAVRLVGNINAAGNPEAGFYRLGTSNMVVLANRYAIFSADDSAFGEEPWVHDMVSGVTRRLGDLNPGAVGSRPDDFSVAGGRVVFIATTPNEGEELWVTDGTPAGTELLADIYPGQPSSYVSGMAATTGNRVVFSANDGTHGTELWISDGTPAGTVLAHDLVSGAGGSSPSSFTTIGARLFFRAFDSTHGGELWMWDAGGVGRVADIEPGNAGSNPSELIAAGANLVFRACRTSEGCELWRSDGSAAGTTLLADVRFGVTGSDPLHLVWHAGFGRVFFDADDGVNGRELWEVNGVGAASRISSLVAGSGEADFEGAAAVGARLLFVADAGLAGARLYAWDGASVTQLAILSTAGPGFVDNFVLWNGRAYLGELDCWYSDGTVAGTIQWDPDCDSNVPFAVGGGRLLYGSYGDDEREIWSISAADVIAKESEFTDFSSNPAVFAFRTSGAAFAADGGTTGVELVVENAANNSFSVIDLLAGATSSRPDELTLWRDEIWLSATSASTGHELWHTDGTLVGTTPFELVAGASSSFPQQLLPVGNQLYLVAED
ncbi:MAG: ELWxxDGT repeat protein, partial [Dokdonella sp.]